MARTRYLVDKDPMNAFAALARFPLGRLWADLRREPREFLKDILLSLPAARRLALACRAEGITHVHAHSARRAATICALAHQIWGLDYSVTLHGPVSDYGPGQRFKWRGAAFGTVITRKLMAELSEILGPDRPERLMLQPMGVDTEALAPSGPYVPYKPGKPLRIFACGRLNIVKGHQDLMQSVAILRARGIDAKLEIAGQDDDGGGGYSLVLADLRQELGLNEHVTLLGAISAEAVREKLLSADLFVLASWHEPLGVAYMEAMSCGLPTIGTDAGGVPELITHGEDGLLVPPKSPDALAEAIAQLIENPALMTQLSESGRRRVVKGFSSARGAHTLLDGIAG